MFLSRSAMAYLCPNMINFDGVDSSKRRSEEVISFSWRSVYIHFCRKYKFMNTSLQHTHFCPKSSQSLVTHFYNYITQKEGEKNLQYF